MRKATLTIEQDGDRLLVRIEAEGEGDPALAVGGILAGEALYDGDPVHDLLVAALDAIVDVSQEDEATDGLVFELHGQAIAAADLFAAPSDGEGEEDGEDPFEDEDSICYKCDSQPPKGGQCHRHSNVIRCMAGEDNGNAQRRLDEIRGRSHGHV